MDDGLYFDEHVFRDGPLEKLWGGWRGRVKYKKKRSCKGKLSEKKFMHAE